MLARCYLGLLTPTDSDDLEEEEDGTEDNNARPSSGRKVESESETRKSGIERHSRNL